MARIYVNPSSSFQVENNIPVPSAKRGHQVKPCPYPFGVMEVGSSFQVGPCEDEKLINKVRSAAQQWCKEFASKELRTPTPKFITREVTDDAERAAGVRYWRVWRTA